MSQLNWCHKNVWIYYYYYYSMRFKCESLWFIWQDIKWTNIKDSLWRNWLSKEMIELIESDTLEQIDWSSTSTASD